MIKKTVAVLLAFAALAIGGAVFYVTRSISLTGAPGKSPGRQPPVATIEAGNLDLLRSRFNASAATPRLLLVLSPT